jgi:transglutaminase-like putative cysteine protease
LDDLSERQYAAFSGLWARLRGLSSLSKIKLEELLRESTMWVQQTISFEPHAGFPDPLLALERGRGDCNERSAALALILSSFGLRVEQVFGLLWLSDKHWGLHAWVRVFTPWGWIELDPSMRSLATQTRIGPEHIALTAGEGAAQSDLSLIFGRWEAEISQ